MIVWITNVGRAIKPF